MLKLRQQLMGRAQIAGLEALLEWRQRRFEQRSGLGLAPVSCPAPRERDGGAQLPRDGTLLPRRVDGAREAALGLAFIGRRLGREQLPFYSQHLGQIERG